MNFAEALQHNFRTEVGNVPVDRLGQGTRDAWADFCLVLDSLQQTGGLQLSNDVTPETLLEAVAAQMEERRAATALGSSEILFPGEKVPGV